MIVYIPQLIESAEQAEALPVGIVARSDGSDGEPTHACLRMANGWWCTDETNDDGTPFLVPHAGMVGDIAFEPVEVEEIQSEGTGWVVPTVLGPKLAGAYLGSRDGTPPKRYIQTTWRTPWEEA